jgi:hypothetical protein
MNNVKKLATAVAAAIGVAGIGASQADESLYSYVVSGTTVTTILSVVNTDPNPGGGLPNTIHWRYQYKEGANATDNLAGCTEVDFRWSSSPNDLLDISVDETFGTATRGVLFNDPSTNASYAPTTVSLSLLRGLTQPIRAYTVVDNNDDQAGGVGGAEGSLLAERATIIEFVNGAAWGYAGYNSNAAPASYLFNEPNERFGEAFGPAFVNDGAAISFKPFADWTSTLFVTPLAGPNVTNSAGVVQAGIVQTVGNLRVRVQLALLGLAPTDVVYDRDENVVSGRVPQDVVCVGEVRIPSLMSTGAQLLVQDTGGWGVLQSRPGGGGANLGTPVVPAIPQIRTEEAVIQFLEYTAADGAVDGTPVGGVVNNGYMLQEL